jgi:DNA-binding XRE family transcriptional regulator
MREQLIDEKRAVRAFDAALARGEEELVPAAVVDRLLAGEPPLRVWREHRGFSQTGLAAASGVHRVVIADIESGRKRGSLDAHVKLARALGLLVDDLIAPPAAD